jgi:hypothetical protein
MPQTRSNVAMNLDFMRRNLSKSRYIYIGDTCLYGLGIFAARSFVDNEKIISDHGNNYFSKTLTYQEICQLNLDLSRDCFQVDKDQFLLPTGSIDDLINHSCQPSTGIRLSDSGYDLIALRDIQVGEELTYDYSTYIDSPERLLCSCGTMSCRREIGRFGELGAHLRTYYISRGVVGAFAARSAFVEDRHPQHVAVG